MGESVPGDREGRRGPTAPSAAAPLSRDLQKTLADGVLGGAVLRRDRAPAGYSFRDREVKDFPLSEESACDLPSAPEGELESGSGPRPISVVTIAGSVERSPTWVK